MPNFNGRYATYVYGGNKYINESLPNITGFLNGDTFDLNKGAPIFWKAEGAFEKSLVTYTANVASYVANNAYQKATRLTFDASKSSAVYVNGANVKPNSIVVLYCIKY